MNSELEMMQMEVVMVYFQVTSMSTHKQTMKKVIQGFNKKNQYLCING
jgi:hypothetical protein